MNTPKVLRQISLLSAIGLVLVGFGCSKEANKYTTSETICIAVVPQARTAKLRFQSAAKLAESANAVMAPMLKDLPQGLTVEQARLRYPAVSGQFRQAEAELREAQVDCNIASELASEAGELAGKLLERDKSARDNFANAVTTLRSQQLGPNQCEQPSAEQLNETAEAAATAITTLDKACSK